MPSRSMSTARLCGNSFATELGWFCLLGSTETGPEGDVPVVSGLVIGHASRDQAREAAVQSALKHGWISGAEQIKWTRWNLELQQRLTDYAAGRPVEFDDVRLQPRDLTDFQQRVLQRTRQLRFGQTMTYGELAESVGSPRAARAVGSVMAGNTVPVIVPCHRVVASGGRFGGFSAPQGPALKRQMLALEDADGGAVSGLPGMTLAAGT